MRSERGNISQFVGYRSLVILSLLILLLIASCAHDTSTKLESDIFPLVSYPEPNYSEQGRLTEEVILPLLRKHHVHLGPSTFMRQTKTVYVLGTDKERARQLVTAAIKENHLDAQLIYLH
jgi:hypothetical protein